jgi:glycosidase
MADFKTFVDEAHRRGLRVITELVVNHTSDQHPWFQQAQRAVPGSQLRDFYVWSDTAEKYKEARIIFDVPPLDDTRYNIVKRGTLHGQEGVYTGTDHQQAAGG